MYVKTVLERGKLREMRKRRIMHMHMCSGSDPDGVSQPCDVECARDSEPDRSPLASGKMFAQRRLKERIAPIGDIRQDSSH